MSGFANIEKLRRICLSLPGATEVEAWGHPTFRTNKKMFCACGVGDDGIASCTFKADPALRDLLLDEAGFYLPPYVGHKGWLGLKLVGKVNWGQVRDLVIWSFKQTAPKKLLKQHGLT